MTNNLIKPKDRKSLCEESLLVFVNILKLSSVALARRTLSSTSDYDDDHVSLSTTKFNGDDQSSPRLSPMVQPQRSKRSQKPQEPKLSYVMIPDDDPVRASSYVMKDDNHDDESGDGQFADYIRRFHQKTENDLQNSIVEGKAANYIKKFHEKNRNDLNNESMRRLNYVLPPPPRKVFK